MVGRVLVVVLGRRVAWEAMERGGCVSLKEGLVAVALLWRQKRLGCVNCIHDDGA
jgi:hypothetical protein